MMNKKLLPINVQNFLIKYSINFSSIAPIKNDASKKIQDLVNQNDAGCIAQCSMYCPNKYKLLNREALGR